MFTIPHLMMTLLPLNIYILILKLEQCWIAGFISGTPSITETHHIDLSQAFISDNYDDFLFIANENTFEIRILFQTNNKQF